MGSNAGTPRIPLGNKELIVPAWLKTPFLFRNRRLNASDSVPMHPHGFRVSTLSTGRVGEFVIMQCNIRSCFTGVQHLGVNSRMKRLGFISVSKSIVLRWGLYSQ